MKNKKISVLNLAQMLINFTLKPYELSKGSATNEQKWIIMCSIIKSLKQSMPIDMLIKSDIFIDACFNFSALAEMDESMLMLFFTTPDALYKRINEVIYNGFIKRIESNYFKNLYKVEDCE